MTSYNNIKQDIVEILQILGVKSSIENDNDSLRNIGISSIVLIEFIVEIENKFDIVFPIEKIYSNELDSIRGIVSTIEDSRK